MFTGIIEATTSVIAIADEGSNKRFTFLNPFDDPIYIDQSIAHNGCCMTVVEIDAEALQYSVVAIDETLKKTECGSWQVGMIVNLERCMKVGGRLDGHFVQGHVDTTTKCLAIENKNGSYEFTFDLPSSYAHLIVDKGSIAINGISLTAILLDDISKFKVAIIPYTWDFTSMKYLNEGQLVNLEFDILGKYISRIGQLSYLKS